MAITNFAQLTTHTRDLRPDQVFGRGEHDKLALREPLKPPGRWTHFKAALSSFPMLRSIGSVRQAREQLGAFSQDLKHYQATNKDILAGFMRDLRHDYGNEIATMAMKHVQVEDGAPLSMRTVAAALNEAEARQSFRAANHQTLTRLLESSLQEPSLRRNERDMNTVFRHAGLQRDGQTNWSDAIGAEGTRFVTQFVMRQCAQMPESAERTLTNAQLVDLMRSGIEAYKEIAGVPGLEPPTLSRILDDASSKPTAASMLENARENAVMHGVETALDRKSPAAVLHRVAQKMNATHGVQVTDAVLKSISVGMGEAVRNRIEGLPAQLKCQNDAGSIHDALQPVVEKNIETALAQHCEALKAIDSSITLNDAQKKVLRDIAQTRRLDPVQVTHYENMARAVNAAMHASSSVGGDPVRAMTALMDLRLKFGEAVKAMQANGASFWESNSLRGGDTMDQLFDHMARLAAAGLSDHDARRALEGLQSPGMTPFLQGVNNAPSMWTRSLVPQYLTVMTDAIAMRLGLDAGQASALSGDVLTVSDLGQGEELPPEVTLAVLTADPDVMDARGVLETANDAHDAIQKGFSVKKVMTAEAKDAIVANATKDPESKEVPGLADTLVDDANRALFKFNGKTISHGDKAGVLNGFTSSFPAPEDAALKLAVSRFMNQQAISHFKDLCDNAAMPGMLVAGQTVGSQFACQKQHDGSWTVNATTVLRPTGLMNLRTQELQPIEGRGLNAYSLLVKFTPVPGAKPLVEIIGSQAVYNF